MIASHINALATFALAKPAIAIADQFRRFAQNRKSTEFLAGQVQLPAHASIIVVGV